MHTDKVIAKLEFEVLPGSQLPPLEELIDAIESHVSRFPYRFVGFNSQWGTAKLNLISATVTQEATT